MRNAGLDEAQAGIMIAGGNIINLRYAHGEGNGNPLQYSCPENPRDRGAWWAAIYGIAQSRTRLKQLSSSSSSSRYADDTTLITESEEELKSLLMKVKEESENISFKLNIQKTKIMASCPITSWQTDGETVETVPDFIFWAPKSLSMVTAAMKLKDACSLEGML